jgi:hypothetical protein
MGKITSIWALCAGLALAACGETDLERGITGAAIGGVGAAAVDGDAFTGALIGGAAGVMCDDLTDYCR